MSLSRRGGGCLDACVGTWGRVKSSDCVTSFVSDSDFVCDYYFSI